MANKLYDEASIKDIANAIREKNGKADAYTVAQMGSAIRGIQTETTEENRRVYTGTITTTTVGQGAYVVLAKDSILAEHRSDLSLFVRVEFDIEPTAYTVVKNWAGNVNGVVLMDSTTNKQLVKRWDGSALQQITSSAISIDTDEISGVGQVRITEDGELRIYSNSNSNYAIRPSNYTVRVEW